MEKLSISKMQNRDFRFYHLFCLVCAYSLPPRPAATHSRPAPAFDRRGFRFSYLQFEKGRWNVPPGDSPSARRRRLRSKKGARGEGEKTEREERQRNLHIVFLGRV